MIRRFVPVLQALAAAASLGLLAPAAQARIGASTRLQHCGDQTCLMIKGRRSDPEASVIVARHELAVEGGRRWRAVVPLAMVQQWTGPFARSISVEVAGEGAGAERAALPIGLFGQTTQLTFLDVTVRR